MNDIISFLFIRLSEPSTWRGLVWLITAFGVALSPDAKEAIAALGMALAGLIGVFVEKGNAHTDEEIVQIVKKEQQNKVEKIVTEKKVKPNAKTKQSNSDNFFND